MTNDTLSDVLTRIRNGSLNKSQVVVIPLTRLSQQICHTLQKEGFIESFQRDDENKENFLLKRNNVQKEALHLSSKQSFLPRQIIVRLKYKQTARSKQSCITNLRRVSKPGLRVYTNYKQIPTVLGGLGILILSTSQGIMTDREARFRKLGGEILCSVW